MKHKATMYKMYKHHRTRNMLIFHLSSKRVTNIKLSTTSQFIDMHRCKLMEHNVTKRIINRTILRIIASCSISNIVFDFHDHANPNYLFKKYLLLRTLKLISLKANSHMTKKDTQIAKFIKKVYYATSFLGNCLS